MKVFNGRSATDEYMSTHSLTFSTPEMTLKKFAFWLGDLVNSPDGKGQIPRLLLYLEERGSDASDTLPDINDTFRPSGAVTDMYSGEEKQFSTDQLNPPKIKSIEGQAGMDNKFCIECGFKIKSSTRFCTKCGTKQP